MTFFMQMCVLQNSQTYDDIGNSGCYECQEPDGVARMAGAKRPSIEGEARDKAGEGLGEPLPRKILKNSNLK